MSIYLRVSRGYCEPGPQSSHQPTPENAFLCVAMTNAPHLRKVQIGGRIPRTISPPKINLFRKGDGLDTRPT
jgi:hypothetical protein